MKIAYPIPQPADELYFGGLSIDKLKEQVTPAQWEDFLNDLERTRDVLRELSDLNGPGGSAAAEAWPLSWVTGAWLDIFRGRDPLTGRKTR